MHESTKIMCMAWRVAEFGSDSPPTLDEVRYWEPGLSNYAPFPEDLAEALKDPQTRLNAHNAAFEIAIWNHCGIPKYKFPRVRLQQWACSAALCAYRGVPRSLANAAKALGVPAQKDSEGHKLMLRLCKPLPARDQTRLGTQFDDDPEKIARVGEYCRQDVLVETQIEQRLGHRLPTSEQNLWLLDQMINQRGLPVDIAMIDGCISMARLHQKRLNSQIRQITGGAVDRYTQRQKLLDWIHERFPELQDLRAKTIMRTLREKHAPQPVLDALEVRRSGARSSVAKFVSMSQRGVSMGENGIHRICDAHLYHGAHTGRWAGKGVQLQNVPRGSISWREHEQAVALARDAEYGLINLAYTDFGDFMVSMIRPTICAPEGSEFVVCDFSGIEARVLAWLAKHERLIALIKNGADTYKVLAAEIYGLKSPDDVEPWQRQVGKVAVLGLGYGMGADKFAVTADNFGVRIEPEFAKKVVEVYREFNRPIVELWYGLDNAARHAVEAQTTTYAGAVRYDCTKDNVMRCMLPSKRLMHYRDAKIEKVDDPERPWAKTDLSYYSPSGQRASLYGGKLAENVVQAVARDLLAEAMLRLHHAGVRIVGHVHDEVICESRGETTLEQVSELMCELPEWAAGCPIAAEGYVSRRYRK